MRPITKLLYFNYYSGATTVTSEPRIKSFEEFWPYYVRAHRHRSTQVLHVIGSLAALAWILICCWQVWWRMLPLALVLGYGPAWIGHFFFEHNRPATFEYTLWSFLADWVMVFYFLTGKMAAEVQRHGDYWTSDR